MPTLGVAGDTMLGRFVASQLTEHSVRSLFEAELLDVLGDTDGMLLNLECCISERGTPAPERIFHFRAPPAAVEALQLLGVRCVTLANNHTLDFGERALHDTIEHLTRAGIAVVGAGPDVSTARTPAQIRLGRTVVTVVGFTDDPARYSAGGSRPGVAYADIGRAAPKWLSDTVRQAPHPLIVTPHWGPNMTVEPLPYIRRTAGTLVELGADLVAGHSAHVFHGVAGRVIYDMGDLIDDYAVDSRLRNDLSLLWLVGFDARTVVSIDAVPLRLLRAHTMLARGEDFDWIVRRLRAACERLGTGVSDQGGRLHIDLPAAA